MDYNELIIMHDIIEEAKKIKKVNNVMLEALKTVNPIIRQAVEYNIASFEDVKVVDYAIEEAEYANSS